MSFEIITIFIKKDFSSLDQNVGQYILGEFGVTSNYLSFTWGTILILGVLKASLGFFLVVVVFLGGGLPEGVIPC